MIGKVTMIDEHMKGCWIEFQEPFKKIEMNIMVNVQLKKKTLNKKMQGYYFSFLQYCLKYKEIKQVYYSVTALHEACKAYMSEVFYLDFMPEFSVMDLSYQEFDYYITNLEFSFFNEHCKIYTGGFVQTYNDFKSWQNYYPAGTFKEFMELSK